MPRNSRILCGILLASLGGATFSSAQVTTDLRLNITLNGTYKFKKTPYWVYTEFQPRWRDNISGIDQTNYRLAFGAKAGDNASVLFGYGLIENDLPAGGETIEDRLYGQYLKQFNLPGGIRLQSRTRLEHRRRNAANDTGYRFRHMFKASKPIAKGSATSYVVSNEYFYSLNSTDWGARPGFDQNRFFVGTNTRLSDDFRLEFGYQNQYANARNGDRMFHMILATLTFEF